MGFDSASRAHFRSESVQRFIYFIKINTLYSWKECDGPIGVSGVNHLFDHIFMMQMISFNFGF